MKIHLDNQDFSRMATELCSMIVPFKHKFKYVVGIERGGIPISTWLSYVLGKKHTSVIVSLYGDSDVLGHESKIDLSNLPEPDEPFLLVDDIVDSGNTIRLIELEGHLVQGIDFYLASLHFCEENNILCVPDFFVEIKKADDWIVYPWEKNE